MSRCKSCMAEIVWLRTTTNRRIPIDAEPVEGGNITIQNGVAVVKRSATPTLFQPDGPTYVSHFTTCPNADEHRNDRP